MKHGSRFLSKTASLGQALVLIAATSSGNMGATENGTGMLANEKIRVTISDSGKLLSIENKAAAETYAFESDAFELDTDRGEFSNRDSKPHSVRKEKGRIFYEFDCGQVRLILAYTLKGDNGFIRRSLEIVNRAPIRVKNLVLNRTKFSRAAAETLHYRTFIAAPTVNFIRYEKGGMFSGIENPYFHTLMNKNGITLSFEPALILKAGEGYRSEPQFIGVYRNSGVTVADSGRPFRYNSNGSGYKPLDRNETRAVRACALDYLDPSQKQFLNINYQFFHPLPQMPGDAKAADYFYKTIDTFSEIGGDMIIFKPLHRYRKPTGDTPYWNVVPDDPNHTARKICDYATGKGVRYGFYMGCAAHGGEGNAAGLNFRPDKPKWKKTDARGNRAPDNCLACDEFYEWWFTVQNNTIRKYGLANWSWDPSLGSGMNCHDESHGHLANKGGYKGWRRCIELMRRLKAENPDLFIQGFYGTKNFGLWGLKHVDQHEVYNEQTIIVSTKHKQISDDRQQADGLRFQNNWSMRFRFTPAVTGHSLVHRISEGGFRPELVKAWDYSGWKYSVMSSLAIAGSLMPTILPYETRLVPGYVDFYRKWSEWAEDTFEYVNHTEPFGEQVACGAVDGYARIKGDHGFVFLFNGNPRPAEVTFEVGDEINLQQEGTFRFIELYPSEKGKLLLDSNSRSTFARGEKARVTVPADSCRLLELKRAGQQSGPRLAGIAGNVTRGGTSLDITDVSGRPGTVVDFAVRLPAADRINKVTVNGVSLDFGVKHAAVTGTIQFAGRRYERELDRWHRPDGTPFHFPFHAADGNLTLESVFCLEPQVAELLKEARPANFEEMGKEIDGWYRAGNRGDLGYHNFIGCRPERLWLVIPTLRRTGCTITINGCKVENQMVDRASDWIHADITDMVAYGKDNRIELLFPELAANNFMGPFLIYPEEARTTAVLPRPRGGPQPVVYTRSLDPPPPPRYRHGACPVVQEARMLGEVRIKGRNRRAAVEVKVADYTGGIARVMYFESGFGWMGQHPLGYDAKTGTWRGHVSPGQRWRIQEHEFIYVWAEGTDGLRSEYFPVKVDWDFGK